MTLGADPRRLVMVTSPRGERFAVATGYLISDRLVLTARHRLGEGIRVKRVEDGSDSNATIVWQGDRSLDAALLETEVGFDLDRAAALAWGRLAKGEAADWFGAGFPAARVDPGELRPFVPLSGTVAWGRGTLELTVEAGVSEPKRWAGISGAPVLVDGALVGLVATVPKDFCGRRLIAEPIDPIIEHLEARGALSGEPVVVPRGPLRSGIRRLDADNPAALLLAQHRIVPFDWDIRSSELDRLREWLGQADRSQSVALLAGAGGSGKTRLLIELCRDLRKEGWRAGFLDAATPLDAATIRALLEGSRETLVVLDYAARRPDLARGLRRLVELHAERGGPHLRVLLGDRSPADWWPELARDLGERGRAVGQDPVFLRPVKAEKQVRRQLFQRALQEFAEHLGAVPRADALPNLEDRRFERILFLHVAALLAQLGEKITPDGLLDALLRRESAWWVPDTLKSCQRHVHNAVTALTLLGGAETRVQALRRIAAGAGRSALDRATPNLSARECEQLCDHLHRVYGGPADRPHLLPLEPDLLAEHLAWTTLHALEEEGGDQALDFLDRTTEDADPASLGHALETLAGAAAENRAKDSSLRERAVRWLQHILEADPRRRCPIAFQVARGELGDRLRAGELDTALGRVLEACGDPELAREFDSTIGASPTIAVRATAVAALRVLLKVLPNREQHREQRARLLNNLGADLSALGRREEALEPASDAVEILRRLAEEHPDVFLPNLAMSLNNLGNQLSTLGRGEEALETTREAVEIYRRLGEERADAFLPDLARSLNNLGVFLSNLGYREEALETTREAVDIRRRLAEERADAFLPDLAGSLSNLGARLSDLGRREEALEATREAVDIRRRLAEERADAFLPDLARSLNNLGVFLSNLGYREEALETTREAVDIRRRLAEERADAFLPDLAVSLSNLGARLSDLGRREEALETTREAVDIYRRLAAERPDAFLPYLAVSLNNLGESLFALGHREEALEATRKAADIHRRLAEEHPDAFLPGLATSLNNLGVSLSALGRREEALEATREAVEILRRLAEKHPDVFLPDLARSLNNLGVFLSDLGYREEALETTRQAVEIFLALAERWPEAFAGRLATAVRTLDRVLPDGGQDQGGQALLRKARELLERLGGG